MKRFILLFVILWAMCFSAYSQASGLADLKFGQYQIADSQWNVSACTQTNTCQIYSKNPGTAYKIPWTNGQLQWAVGDYVKFEANIVQTGSHCSFWNIFGICIGSQIPDYGQSTTNPWLAKQYTANGTLKATMGAGHIINMGADYFFFVGSDNNTGQLFSMTTGFSNTSGVTWTGTLNPSVSQVNTYATGGSTTPLAAGETVVIATAPAYPSYVTIGSGTTGSMTFNGTTSITTQQQSNVDTWTARTLTGGNQIFIEQVSGNSNNVTMSQDGNQNLTRAKLDGNSNTINVKQGTQGTGQNEIKLNVVGSNNSLDVKQSRDNVGNGTGVNGHYQLVDVTGSNNTLTAQQSNTGGVGGHYMETTVNGNQNSITARQTDNGNKIMFTTITGNNNIVDAVQKGTGQHYLENKLTGNNNNISAVQEGSTANRATLDLTNAGGPASVILQQNGGQTVGVITSCATAGGCAPITVRQGY